MAKLKMKKIELIAMLTDSKKIIELLQRRGVVEITKNTDEELENTNVTAVVGEFEKFRSTAAQALEIIDSVAPEKVGLADMFSGKTEVEKHDFGREAM
jgi:V/A-type H+-transporting ATPase subunit I